MKKETEDLIKKTVHMTESMSTMTVDNINESAPEATITEDPQKLLKEVALKENAIWLKPKRTLQASGKLPEKWKKLHAHDWEYVCGSFQPEVTGGRPSNEPKTFWFSKWPGDMDCLWEVPVNRKVYLPRMIALYLSGEKDPHTGMESMKYHSFDYIQRPEPYWKTDDFTHQFSSTGTHYRGRFVPIGVFS